MIEVTTIGSGITSNVYHAHGTHAVDHRAFSRRIARGNVLEFSSGSRNASWRWRVAAAHHWARELKCMGREVQLIPLAYVKLFAKCKRTMRPMPRQSARGY